VDKNREQWTSFRQEKNGAFCQQTYPRSPGTWGTDRGVHHSIRNPTNLEPNDKGFDGQFLQYDWGWKNHEKSMNTHYPAQKHGKTGS
jgi:hypothetical protein